MHCLLILLLNFRSEIVLFFFSARLLGLHFKYLYGPWWMSGHLYWVSYFHWSTLGGLELPLYICSKGSQAHWSLLWLMFKYPHQSLMWSQGVGLLKVAESIICDWFSLTLRLTV